MSKALYITPTTGASGAPPESQAKMKKAASKHRLDHSNPGGVVSEFFRQKRSRVL